VAPLPELQRDPHALRAAYEALREAVLAGDAEGWRQGHGVLATRGMAAWITAWTTLAPAGAGTTADLPHPPTASSEPRAQLPTQMLSSLPHAGAVVAVIAEMALAHL
jgi:hypothetical protein